MGSARMRSCGHRWSWFIGSHLAGPVPRRRLRVTAYDNLDWPAEFLKAALRHPASAWWKVICWTPRAARRRLAGHDFVFHLAANADVRLGTAHPHRDLEQNTIATFNVLEAMRANGVRRLAFASPGRSTAEPDVFPTPKTRSFPIQTIPTAPPSWPAKD